MIIFCSQGKFLMFLGLILVQHICSFTTFSQAALGFSSPIERRSRKQTYSYPNFSTISPEPTGSLRNDEYTESESRDEKKSYLDDGFVFGLEGSGLNRPKGKVAQVVLEGDSLDTKPWQIAIVGVTFLSHFIFSANAITHLHSLNSGDLSMSMVEIVTTLLSSWILADLGSGIFHWSVDNYGNGKTPILGAIIAAFQGHHSAPWTITERGFCNNVYKLCIPFGIPTVAFISFLAEDQYPLVTLFFIVFCFLEIGSQEFHKWSHMTPSKLNPTILWLQKVGILIDRTPHAMHHNAPYDGNYCIVSGFCNNFLDETGFFRRMEKIIYDINGIESNAWKLDSKLRTKTLKGDYLL